MPRGERKNLISTSIHVEVLAAARRQCDAKDWTFKPVDIVHCLPHLNPSSVRTHVVSRCCVNAPVNHAHRWPYFRRMKRGVYQILPEFRQTVSPGAQSGEESTVGEVAARYEKQLAAPSAIHAVVVESDGWYVAECLETAVVTQGRSLDELLGNLRSALELQLDDEEIARAGLSPKPRLVVSYETLVLHALMPRLRRLTSREILRILVSFGFKIVTTRGSHAKLVRVLESGERQVLTLPIHSQLAIGTVRAIYRQASRYIPASDLQTKFFSN